MATLDAAPNSKSRPVILSKLLDADVIKMIDRDMERYERLGCVFLLIEDFSAGYEQLSSIQNNELCLSKFIEKHRISYWQDKVLEALCLRQNYEILIKLGIEPEYACTVYSTKIVQAPYRINKYAKVFYSFFDRLSSNEVQRLLQHVYRNILPPDCQNWPEEVSLELHLLWWIHNSFIQVAEDKWMLDRFLKILKELDMSGSFIYDILYDLNVKDTRNGPCHLDNQSTNVNEIRTTVRNSVNENERTTNVYKIDNGLVVIFNQLTFAGPIEWERRTGSEKDCHLIKTTFRDKFGFEIETHTNLHKNEIYSELDDLASRAKDYDCVVVFILSHGTYGNIIASDGAECPIDEIRSRLCSKALENKPKVLVIQACQKQALTTDSPRIGQNDVRRFKDLLELCSTIPGEASIRDPMNGTWFIRILCKVLVENEGMSAYDCFTNLNQEFEKLDAEIDGSLMNQLPQMKATLAKTLILPRRAKAANR